MGIQAVLRLVTFAAIAAVGGPAESAASGLEAFEQAMKAWVMANNVSAASLAVMKDDRLVFAVGYGARTANERVPVWSLSKAITGFCTATLIDAGRFSFDTTIGQIAGGTLLHKGPPADHRISQVTISALLSHRSGLPREAEPGERFSPGMRNLLRRVPPNQAQFAMLTDMTPGLRLREGFENRYEYSNLNYLLLGLAIEAVAGKDYVTTCRERVLDRAGITDAGLAPRWGGLTWAAGGWALSGPEYLAFMRLWRPREPDLLGPATRAWMSNLDGRWLNSQHSDAYTLGVFIHRNLDGTRNIAHPGGWVWQQPDAAGGAISETYGTQAVLLPDGVAWFASHDGIEGGSPKSAELMRILLLAHDQVSYWPAGDLFARMGVGPLHVGTHLDAAPGRGPAP